MIREGQPFQASKTHRMVGGVNHSWQARAMGWMERVNHSRHDRAIGWLERVILSLQAK
jgi:hypothetical protein